MRYLVQSEDGVVVKGYWFLSFAKNIAKSIGTNISKPSSGKYSQKLLDHAKQSATDAIKTTSKRVIQKTAEQLDSIGNKIADRITKVYKTFSQNNSEMTADEHVKEIPKERYVSPGQRQEIIHVLRLM